MASELEAVSVALYPIVEAIHMPVAATINPEAGRHPIPSDPREIEAARRAAERCLDAFPYFEARYGERGRRFAVSDSAWLVTLGDLDDEQLKWQVLWLGRVLATRGMPRITLEVHLTLLHEELTAANPGKRSAYDRLWLGVEQLRTERFRYIDPIRWRFLTQQFTSRVAHQSDGLEKTGDLLLGAVSDELTGIPGAVESIETWLADPTRFSQPWCAAVRDAIRAARAETTSEPNAD